MADIELVIKIPEEDFSTMKPTDKQTLYVKRIIDKLGEERVLTYIKHFYPHITSISECNRVEAQKIITGLSSFMPSPIFNVYMRDIGFYS